MNATGEVRHLLDECGVEWVDDSNAYVDVTEFVNNGIKWTIISDNRIGNNDMVTLRTENITPEQAVATTLGRWKLTEEQVLDAIFDSCKERESI